MFDVYYGQNFSLFLVSLKAKIGFLILLTVDGHLKAEMILGNECTEHYITACPADNEKEMSFQGIKLIRQEDHHILQRDFSLNIFFFEKFTCS